MIEIARYLLKQYNQKPKDDRLKLQASLTKKLDNLTVRENVDSSSNTRLDVHQESHFVKEGIVTAIDSNNETITIDNRYEVNQKVIGHIFKELKCKSRVKYIGFINKNIIEIKNVEIIVNNQSWENEDQEDEIIENECIKQFSTENRTVIGKIVEFMNQYYTVECENRQEIHFRKNDYNIEFDPIVGDIVRLKCEVRNDNSFISGSDCIINVIEISPLSKHKLMGRVTEIRNEYVIIDDNAIYYIKNEEHNMNIKDKIEYTKIESEQMDYKLRVINIESHQNNEIDNGIPGYKNVYLKDITFVINLKSANNKKFININNKSEVDFMIQNCILESRYNIFSLQNEYSNIKLNKINGRQAIVIILKPSVVGSFSAKLTVDFGVFQKSCNIEIIVSNESVSSDRMNIREAVPCRRIGKPNRFIEIRMRDYSVPDDLRALDLNKNRALIREDLLQFYPELFQNLSEKNYKKKLRLCLFLDELMLELAFNRYKIDRASFENVIDNQEEYLKLYIHDISEKRPSIAIGDSVLVSDPSRGNRDEGSVFQGCVYKLLANALLIKFHNEFHLKHGNRSYNIEFRFSRTSLKKQHHALDKVCHSKIGMNCLFPNLTEEIKNQDCQLDLEMNENGVMNYKSYDMPIEWNNKQLNMYQKRAVFNILRGECRPLPYVIYGPPGTGKTMTVIESILQISKLIPQSRIIIATPSNSAADLILDLIINSGKFLPGDFIRLVSYNFIERDCIKECHAKYCATVDISLDNGKERTSSYRENSNGMKINVSKTLIGKHKIIISTQNSIGLLMHFNYPPGHFTHVIIDETGQSTETETLIPISLLNSLQSQIILAGDPKQLGPNMMNSFLNNEDIKFNISFLERLSHLPMYINEDERFITMLKKNYRSVSTILQIYNELVYDNLLECMTNDKNGLENLHLMFFKDIMWNQETADKNCGVYFVDVKNGTNMRSIDSPSWFNDQEVERIYSFIIKLTKHGVESKDIGIITPYIQQVKRIRMILKTLELNEELKVGTVEEFQGQERKIIIISTVRSSNYHRFDKRFNLGFINCKKRFNVAVSRAKSLLVIFGKSSVLQADDNWGHVISLTKAKGTFVDQ